MPGIQRLQMQGVGNNGHQMIAIPGVSSDAPRSPSLCAIQRSEPRNSPQTQTSVVVSHYYDGSGRFRISLINTLNRTFYTSVEAVPGLTTEQRAFAHGHPFSVRNRNSERSLVGTCSRRGTATQAHCTRLTCPCQPSQAQELLDGFAHLRDVVLTVPNPRDITRTGTNNRYLSAHEQLLWIRIGEDVFNFGAWEGAPAPAIDEHLLEALRAAAAIPAPSWDEPLAAAAAAPPAAVAEVVCSCCTKASRCLQCTLCNVTVCFECMPWYLETVLESGRVLGAGLVKCTNGQCTGSFGLSDFQQLYARASAVSFEAGRLVEQASSMVHRATQVCGQQRETRPFASDHSEIRLANPSCRMASSPTCSRRHRQLRCRRSSPFTRISWTGSTGHPATKRFPARSKKWR